MFARCFPRATVEACVAAAIKAFGRIDIIVNNAGLMTFKTLAEWTADDWLAVLRVDLLSAAFFTQQAFLHMGEAGAAIVNFASVHAVKTSANAAPYAAAKAAMLSLNTSSEGRDRHIRANAVLPGVIDTPVLWNIPNVKSGAETIDKRDVGQPRRYRRRGGLPGQRRREVHHLRDAGGQRRPARQTVTAGRFTLRASALELQVKPAVGGSIARFDGLAEGESRRLLAHFRVCASPVRPK